MLTRARRVIPLTRALAARYDTVIVGGGVHGLSLAYRLALRGQRSVAVLDASYLGSGASGRNHTVVRSGFASPAWTALYAHSKRLWEQLSVELDYNVMLTKRGHLICIREPATTESAEAALETHRRFGVPTRLVRDSELQALIPGVNTGVFDAAIYDPSAGISRHDAVVWGLANAATRLGAALHSHTPVTEVVVERGRVTGVRTADGFVRAGSVVIASGAGSAEVAATAGVSLPTRRLLIESFVTEPHVPFLDPELTFLEDQAYIHQTSRGEFVGGAELPNPPEARDLNVTYDGFRHAARKMIDLIPTLAEIRILRLWGGLVDVSPDGAGLIGPVDEVEGIYVTCGWGGYGYMASIGVGDLLAEFLTSNRMPDALRPFMLSRVRERSLIPDSLVVVDHAGDARAAA